MAESVIKKKPRLITSIVNAVSIPTFPASSNTQTQFDLTKSGYIPLAICGFSGSGTQGLIPQEYSVSAVSNRGYVYYQNVTNAAKIPTRLTVVVLYQEE